MPNPRNNFNGLILAPASFDLTKAGIQVIPATYRRQVHEGDFAALENYKGIYNDIIIIGSAEDRAKLALVNAPSYKFFEENEAEALVKHLRESIKKSSDISR